MKRTIYFFIILAFLSALLTQAGSDPIFADQQHASATGKHASLPATPDHPQTLAAVKSFRCEDVTVVPVSECQALVDLYASTNGAGWTTNTNWLSDPDINTWFGIIVTEEHVTIVSLYGNHLDGIVQETIGRLTHLRLLELAGNQIAGPIPESMGLLIYLEEACFTNNSLTGPIPDSLGNMSSLLKLSFNDNQLSGEIPASLGNLTNLTKFSLGNNRLTGTIPDSLGQLVNLDRLEVYKNKLSGEIPDSLGQLTLLEDLLIFENLLTGSIPLSYTNLNLLTSFDFRKTDLCEPTTPEFLAWKDQVGDGWHGTELICMDYHHYLPIIFR